MLITVICNCTLPILFGCSQYHKMFPSSGYFRGIYCPFYVSGLCERPYCHFRHSRIEEKPSNKQDNSPSYSTSTRPYNPGTLLQPNNYGQKDVATYSTLATSEPAGLVEAYQTSANKQSQKTKTSTCPIPSFSETPQSLPEADELPVRLGSLPKISGLPKPRNKSSGCSDTPSYIPTPKRVEMIIKGAVPSYSPTPKQTERIYKKSSSHTVEYDPVKNFAFREKTPCSNDDVLSDNEDINLSESKETSDSSPLKDDTGEAVFSDNDNNVSENKKSSIVDDDLTDSDEDVSQEYVSKLNSEGKLPNYAELLTPSSFFTNKLNSVDKRLSTESTTDLSVKSNDNIKNKRSSGNSVSHHNSSKHKHHSHQDVNSDHSHSLTKSSTSAKEGEKISLKSSVSTSENKSSSGSSASCDKYQRSSSNSEMKHSHKEKNNSSKDSSQMSSNSHIKQSNKVKNGKNSIENKLEKLSSNSHIKQFHKEKDDNNLLKDRLEKSSLNSLEKQSHKGNKNELKGNSEKCSSNSQLKHSHKDTDDTNSLKVRSEISTSCSSKNGKQGGSSTLEKGNRHKSSSSSSLSSKSSALSSSSKSHFHKTGSSSTSHKSVASHGLTNGHSNHKKEQEAETCDKPSIHKKEKAAETCDKPPIHKKEKAAETCDKPPIHKHSGSKINQAGPNSEVQVKSEHSSGVSCEKRSRRSSNDSGHRSDGHRRKSLSLFNAADIKQEHRESIDKIKGNVKNTERRSSGDNCTQVRRDSNEKYKHEKTKSEGKVRVENGKVGTERRISDLTSNLFGEDSGGSESDSDVEIVDAPAEPPPLVYELSESDNDLDNKSGEEDSSFSYDIDMSDTDTFDECLRIFKETERCLAAKSKAGLGTTPDTAKFREAPKIAEASESLLMSVSKKRMAHAAAGRRFPSQHYPSRHSTLLSKVKKQVKAPTSVQPRLSPAEVMHNRIVEMQKRALLRAAKREGRESELPLKLSDNSSSSANKLPCVSGSVIKSQSLSEAASSLISSQKKREAHTPSMKSPTKTIPTFAPWSSNSFYNKKTEPSKSTDDLASKKLVTISSSASKTEKRKVHEPTQSNLKRPVIPIEFGAKVPSNVRQRYLNLIIDEYLKFSPEDTAFTKGQEEEQAVYNRASNKNIYLRVAVNAIKRIRTEALESQPSSSKKLCPGLASLTSMAASSSSVPTQSHEATLGGLLAAKTSFTLHRSGIAARNLPQTFSGKELYDHLTKYILTEEQLRENGYPRPAEDGSGKAKFYKEDEKDKMLKDNERTCKRCGKMFFVDSYGETITFEQCVYHYSRANKKRVNGFIDSRYGCCNERIGSKGCQVAKCHVHERNKTDCLMGYMKTMSASPSSTQNFSVFSMDCEMVYTQLGLELARVTVIGEDCSVKYETLVKPDADVIDYNTRFSGITEKDMLGVTTNLRGVQAVLLSMICDKTILIGHSLESDLQALKLIHSTVVDTSLVFPHRMGLPYKRALRSLMVDHLQKIIQADDGGHDSKEDAVACMQLMLYKVKADVRRRF